MVPAGKHFEADDLAGGEIHLRFEKRNELAVLETVADALLDLALGDERPFHARVEPYGPGDAPALRPIHGDVGAAQEIRDADFRRGGGGNAREGADLDHALVEQIWPGDRAKRRFGDQVGARELAVGKRKSDRKFVAAEARDDRIRSERFVERPRDLAQ